MSATFDNTKTVYFPTNTGGVMVQVDPATPVDNIFVFESGGYRFKWTPNFNGVYYLSQAKILNGDVGDKTSLLQSILDTTQIKTIELDAQQVITVNGTLNVPLGKVIRFTEGSRITGTGTIDSATIDADYNSHIFDTGITLTNARVTGNIVPARWWGTTGNGVTNDQPAIQKAGDTIITNPYLPRTLYLRPGTYKITSPLIFFSWTGTDYEQFTLNIVGQDAAYFNGTIDGVSPEAVINAESITDTFAIGYQLARSSLIKGLVIKGAFNPVNSPYTLYVNTPYADWASLSVVPVRDERFSPYSGIVIDPFDNSGNMPMPDRYPGLEDLYRGTSNGGASSAVKIEQCRIQGFVVDIMLTPNDETRNAENIHVIECTLEIAKAAYACGQDQTKDNFLLRCISWDRVHTLMDTASYGLLTGQPPYIDGWNVAGDIIQIYNLAPPRAAVAFDNIFAESLWRIGTGNGGAGLTINSGAFNFNQNTNPVIFPPTHLEGGDVIFRGCIIKYYDNQFNKSIRVKGSGYVFQDCIFDMPPLLDFVYSNEPIVSAIFKGCKSTLGLITDLASGKGLFTSGSDTSYLSSGSVSLMDGGVLSGSGYNFIENVNVRLTFNGGYQRGLRIGTQTLTVDNATRTGVLSGLSGSNYEFLIAPTDYLVDEAGNVFGRITSVNRGAGTATVVEVPVDVSGVRVENFAVCWAEVGYGQFIGDVSSGSASITNCEYDTLLPAPYINQRLKIGHSTLTLVIDNISGSTITMSKVADYTATKQLNPWINNDPTSATLTFQSLYTPAELAAGSTWPVLIPIGAKVLTKKNGITGTTGEAYVCTVPGYMSAATLGKLNQAQFAKIAFCYPTTYTPTLTSVANVTSSTPRISYVIVNDNIVTVSGGLDVTPTAGSTLTRVGISLPLSSALANSYDLNGGGSFSAIVTADTTNDRAELSFTSSGTSPVTLKFWFTYIKI